MTEGDAAQFVDTRHRENRSNAFAGVAEEKTLRAYEVGEPHDGSDARRVEERQFRQVQDHLALPIGLGGDGPEETLHLRHVDLARQPQDAVAITPDLQRMRLVLHGVCTSRVWRGDSRPGMRGLPSGTRHTGQERQEISGLGSASHVETSGAWGRSVLMSVNATKLQAERKT